MGVLSYELILYILGPPQVVLIVLYLRHFESPYIVARGRHSAVITACSYFVVWCGFIVTGAYPDTPLWFLTICAYYGTLYSVFFVLDRAILLYTSFCTNLEAKSFQKAYLENGHQTTYVQGWFIRNRRHFSRTQLITLPRVIIFVFSTLFGTGAVLVFAVNHPESFYGTIQDPQHLKNFLLGQAPNIACMFLAVVTRFFLASRMRGSAENFGIVKEMKLYSVFAMPVSVFVSLWTFDFDGMFQLFGLAGYVDWFMITAGPVWIFLCSCVNMGLVVLQARQWDKHHRGDQDTSTSNRLTLEPSTVAEDKIDVSLDVPGGFPREAKEASSTPAATSAVTVAAITVVSATMQKRMKTPVSTKELEAFIRDPEFAHALEAFLQTEFSAENLYFLQAVLKLQSIAQTSAPVEALAFGRSVYENYCSPEAPIPVNLSWTRSQHVKQFFDGDVSSLEEMMKLFESVKLDVLDLLVRDPIRRFRRSPAGREVWAKVTALRDSMAL